MTSASSATLNEAKVAQPFSKKRDVDYTCVVCRAGGVKLWRYSASSDTDLHCGPCALKETKKEHVTLDKNGEHIADKYGANKGQLTPEIGNYVPAVLDANGYYWASGAANQRDDYLKWMALPLSLTSSPSSSSFATS
jgi:hypothetical protein